MNNIDLQGDPFHESFSSNSSLDSDILSSSGNGSQFVTLNRLLALMEEQSKRVDTVLKNQEEIKVFFPRLHGGFVQ